MRRAKSENRRERGSVLAMSALGMLAFLLATGMAVDLGHFYTVKSELQNAADAAALAGASALNSGATGIQRAGERATAAMNSYEFNSKGVTIPSVNVKFAVNLDGPYMDAASAQGGAIVKKIRFVKVETPSVPVQVFFAAPVLGGSKNLRAEATAGMSIPLTTVCDFLPVSVIDYNDKEISPGTTYTFRSAPGGAVSPGNYQILAVAGQGGQDVRMGLAQGVDMCAEPGQEYALDTKPGVTSGPVRVGINTRFDEYGPQVDPTRHPPDTNVQEDITYDQYTAGTPSKAPTHAGIENRRVVIIPIVKYSEYDQGRNVVTFDRFGIFFLKNKVGSGNGGELEAEYIKDNTMFGRGGVGTGAAAANGFMAKPVLYR